MSREEFLADLRLGGDEESLASSWGFAKFGGEWYPLSWCDLPNRIIDYDAVGDVEFEGNTALYNGEIYTTFQPRAHDALMVVSYLSVSALECLGGKLLDGEYVYKIVDDLKFGKFVQKTTL
jgi:hypothetical protein